MSKTIDERVVEMRFDNRDYEKNAHKSMETTEKLKKCLNFQGTSKGLNSLTSAIGTVTQRFSVMDVVGVTALANITNSAVNTGKRMLAALTIDPVKTGLSEYETKINSIQTIMSNTASKGTTMEDVTKALNELNTYADKTIYNFAEMTRNIGTFTAAGVGLEEATSAIQGIANLAAASGSTSQQASTAMYQLSQALSTGTVRLMDWNSVVNASMGGELFQNALKETAREMGVAVDDIIEKSGSFRESLSENWLSADILNTTLRKFTKEGAKEYAESMVQSGKYTKEQADKLLASAQSMEDAATKVKTFTQLWDTLKESAQSGWAQSWEIIIGDFEEAREVLTGLSDVIGGFIGKSAESRNKMLEDAFSSKWPKFTEEINKAGVATKDFEDRLKEVAKKHGISIDEMIKDQGSLSKVIASGKLSTNIIVETLKSFVGETDEVSKSTENLSDKLEYFQKVVNEVWRGDYGNGKKRMEALSKAGYDYATVQSLVNKTIDGHKLTLDDLSDVQLKSIGYTDEQIKSIRELAEEAEKSGTPLHKLIEDIQRPSGRELLFESLKNTLKGLFTVLESVGKAWREIFPQKEQSEALYNAAVALNEFSKKLIVSDETADKITRTFKGLFAIIDLVTTVLGGAFKIAFKVLDTVLGAFGMTIWDLTAMVGDAIVAFRDWVDEHNIIIKAIEALTPHLEKAADAIKGWVASLKESDNIPRDIIRGLVNGFKNGIKFVIDCAKDLGTKIIDTVKDVLGIHSPSRVFMAIGAFCLSGFIMGFTSQTGSFMDKVKGTFTQMINWVSSIDWDMVFLGGLTAGTVASVYKIANALETLASPFEGLADMLEGVGKTVLNFAYVTKRFGKLLKAMAFERISKSLINFALAIAILVGAIMLLTFVDSSKLAASLGVVAALVGLMAGLMVALTALTKSLGDFKEAGFKAAYIAALGFTILMIAGAVIALGVLDPSQLLQGVAAITIISLAIAGIMAATKLLNKDAGVLSGFDKTGLGFKRIAWSFILIAASIKLIGSMSITELAQGAVVIAFITGIYAAILAATRDMTVTLKRHEYAENTMDDVGKMIRKLAWSLILVAVAMKIIATMSWKDIGKGAAVVGGIAVLYAGIMAATKLMTFKVGKDEKAVNSIEHVGKMFGKLGFAILAIAVSIKLLGSMPVNELAKGGTVVGLIFGACVGIMAATKLLSKNYASMYGLGKMAALIGTIGGSMLALAMAIMVLGNLPAEEVIQGSKVVILLMAACVGIMAATKLVSTNEAAANSLGTVGKMMLFFSVSIAALAGAMYILSVINPDRFTAALTAVMLMLAGFAGIVAVTKLLNTEKGTIGTLVMVIITLTVLLGALAGLSFIEPNRLKTAALSIVSVLTSLALILATLKLIINKDVYFFRSGAIKVLLAVIAAVGAIMAGVYLLAKQNPENLEAASSSIAIAIMSVVGMMAALAILSKFMEKISWESLAKSTAGIIVAIIAMHAMIPLVEAISKILVDMDGGIGSPIDAINNAKALSIVIVALLGVSSMMGMFKGKEGNIVKATGCIALLVPVLALIGLVLAMMDCMKVQNGEKNAIILTSTLLALTGIASLVGLLGKSYGKILWGTLAVTALVGVMAAIGGVLALMNVMKVENAVEYATVLVATLTALSGVGAIMGIVGRQTKNILLGSIGLTALVGVMAAIGLVMSMMSTLKPKDTLEYAFALSVTMLALAGVAAVMAPIGAMAKNIALGAAAMLALVGVMAAIGLVMSMMSALEPKRTLEYATALVLVLTALTGVATITGLMGGMAKTIALGALGMLALVGVMAAIGLVLTMMSALKVTNAKENALILSQVLVLLVPVAALTGAIGFMAPQLLLGALGLAALVGVMALIGLVLAMMSALKINNAKENALILTHVLAALVAVGTVLALLGPLNVAIIIGAVGLAALVGVMALVAQVLNMMGKMNMRDGYTNAVTIAKVLEELTKILVPLTVVGMFGLAALTGIGMLIALIGAVGVLAVGIGWIVSKFPTLETFLDKGIPILNKIGTGLGEFVGSVVNGFLEKATQSLPKIGKDLSAFTNNLTPFIEEVKKIDDNVITGVSNLAKALLILTGAELMDAITTKLSTLFGKNSTNSLGVTLVSLGSMLRDFNNALGKDFDASMAAKAATAMKSLVEAVNMMPKEGGIFEKIGEFFTGSEDTEGFGEMIKNFGANLSEFAKAVTEGGLGDEAVIAAVNKAIEVSNKMVELAKSLPNSGGAFGGVMGNNDLDDFGIKLTGYIGSLISVANLVSQEGNLESLNSEAINRVIKITDDFIALSKKIENTGGMAGGITGNNDFDTFGKSLKTYAQSVYDTCTVIGSMMWYLPEDGALDMFIKTTEKLVEVASKIETTGGLKAKVDGDNSLKNFGATLVPFAEDLKEFTEAIHNVNPGVVNRIGQIAEALNKALSTPVDADAAENFGQALSKVATTGINKIQEALEGALDSMKTAGKKLTDKVIEGFDASSPYKDAAVRAQSYMLEELNNAPGRFYSIGSDVARGLAQGIKDYTWTAVQAASAMAAAVEEAAKVDLEVNSPSKVFRRIGMSIPEGFAQGIGKLDNEVADSARSMGNNAINNLRNAISRISETVDGGMDVNPTITPVIDLTNVKTGVDAIGSLLDFDSQVGVMANVGAANAAMARRNQNGANDDVVSELAKLRKDLGKTGNTTYNVNGITYDDGSNIADAVSTLIRTARIERRI